MGERLSTERLEEFKRLLIDAMEQTYDDDRPVVDWVFDHIAAQDEEYARQIEILDNAHDATMTQIMDEKDEEIERLKAIRRAAQKVDRLCGWPEGDPDLAQASALGGLREALGGEA